MKTSYSAGNLYLQMKQSCIHKDIKDFVLSVQSLVQEKFLLTIELTRFALGIV